MEMGNGRGDSEMLIQGPRGLENREQETGKDAEGQRVLNEAPGGLHAAKSSSYLTSRQHVPQLTMPSSCLTFSTQLPCVRSPLTSVVSPLLPPLLDPLLPSLPVLGAPGSCVGPVFSSLTAVEIELILRPSRPSLC